MKQNSGYITIPKALLWNKSFLKLSSSAKVLLLYLLALSNSFRSAQFFQYHNEIEKVLGFSRISMWRFSNELSKLGIQFYSQNKQYIFNLDSFFAKWSEAKKF